MRSERIALRGDPAELALELRALVPAPESVSGQVAEIVAAVRARGDEALGEYTRALDTAGADPPPLRVSESELAAAPDALAADVRDALELAIDNVRRVCEVALVAEHRVELQSHRVTLRSSPVERAAVYVPGGRAPYPSTAVMGVVTAVAAGVADVAVCSPPPLDEAILAASRLAGATTAYRLGGAQAVAALAHGTDSVARVDVIAGPGNLYVQEAKRQLSAQVGIDGFAGPSDLVAVLEEQRLTELAALDLLAQAEHGPGTLLVAISPSVPALDELAERLRDASETGAVAALVEVADLEEALALSQALAPEHLQLMGPQAETLAPRISRAGCLFIGAGAATAFGDYVAGSNHILPTGGSARFASGLSPSVFRRRFSEVRVRKPEALAKAGASLARVEGFELHARSMEARIRENR